MAKRIRRSPWAGAVTRTFLTFAKTAMQAGGLPAMAGARPKAPRRAPLTEGDWLAGIALGAGGARRYRLYRPPGVRTGERLPLLVMLHGCGQDARGFADSTRMNRIAARERFFVLYPEQDRFANAKGCWNWFDTRSGRAYSEAGLIMRAVDQVCALYAVDRTRLAVAGLSAGASMAALLVTQHPTRFKALMMHSGIPPGSANSTMSAVGAMHGHRQPSALAATAALLSSAWPPLLVIHGAADDVVSARNAQAAVRVWAAAGGATASDSRQMQRGKRYPMTVTEFKAKGSTVARLVQVDRLGHAWSGGAASQPFSDRHGPDASAMLWSFAEAQFA